MKPTFFQWIFGRTSISLKLVPKGLCTLILFRHPIRKIFFCQPRYARCMSVKNITQIMYIMFIKINYTAASAGDLTKEVFLRSEWKSDM